MHSPVPGSEFPRARRGAGWRHLLLPLALIGAAGQAFAGELRATVELEEEVYRYAPANNGAGPMWCAGSTCVARISEVVYASGLETLPDAKPLNNCRWVLWRRDAAGWRRVHVDDAGRTREPSPVAVLADGSVYVSANPTLNAPEKEGGGPARPEIHRFHGASADGAAARPERLVPAWKGTPKFSEHSYRSFAADRAGSELILFQNIDYTHAEWTFRASNGDWVAQGQLRWPWGADYAKPQPVRVCYPNVALRGRAVHFCGVSDIQEPHPEWRKFKKELTGKDWDYDFRRLFYAWTPDVTREPFREWIEVSSRDRTGGWIFPADAWVSPDGTVFLLWTERAIDERLRSRFFPDARQSHSLRLAIVRDGKVIDRRVLSESTEDQPGPVVSAARFHERADGRLVMLVQVSDREGARNEVWSLRADGTVVDRVKLGMTRPFGSFFTATPRAGTAPSDVIDILGVRGGTGDAISYARVQLASAP